MPFEYRVSSLSCRRTIHEHRLLVCRRFTSSPLSSVPDERGERLVKCFYDARSRVTALLQDTLLSTAFEIKFQIKIREREREGADGAVVVRASSSQISRDSRFFSFFFSPPPLPFSFELSRTKLCKFELDNFPDDP